jgi:hypothetical protein
MDSLLLTDPLLLTIVTGVGLVLATTAIVLARDASSRDVAPRAEDIVTHPAASQNTTLTASPVTKQISDQTREPIHDQTIDEFRVTLEPVETSRAG